MKRFGDCTFVLLGDIAQRDVFGLEIIKDIELALNLSSISIFNAKDELDAFVSKPSLYSSLLKEIIDSGGKIPLSFLSIIFEDFLYSTTDHGPIALLDLPMDYDYVQRLFKSLSVYQKKFIVTLYFEDLNIFVPETILENFKNQFNNVFIKISSVNETKESLRRLVESMQEPLLPI